MATSRSLQARLAKVRKSLLCSLNLLLQTRLHGPSIIDHVSEILRDVLQQLKQIRAEQAEQRVMLSEALQRLRNKGVLQHPDGMPTLPLSNLTEVEDMEEALAQTANAEYLVRNN